MAQFRGIVSGNSGPASKLGSKANGLYVNCDGWESGVSVQAHYNATKDRDEFTVALTGGSNQTIQPQLLGTFARVGNKMEKV